MTEDFETATLKYALLFISIKPCGCLGKLNMGRRFWLQNSADSRRINTALPMKPPEINPTELQVACHETFSLKKFNLFK